MTFITGSKNAAERTANGFVNLLACKPGIPCSVLSNDSLERGMERDTCSWNKLPVSPCKAFSICFLLY